jgi:hypothetical protein
MSELTVLQAVRLKGRVSPADLAATLDAGPADIATTVQRLNADGLLVGGATLRLTPAGRERLSALLTEERNGVDATALKASYDEFRSINTDFKALVTDWQLKASQPNTHDDTDYDAAVLARLDGVHQRVLTIVAAAATQLPRLSGYSAKLQTALDKVNAGENAWLTRPLIDSYHTVWFELHEELILSVGLTREQAAKSGDAQ